MIALCALLAPAIALALAFAAASRARARQLTVDLQLTREWLDTARAESRLQLERHLRELSALRDRQALEAKDARDRRSEEHTSELQSPCNLVCRLLLEK